jgi:hypothetical protein
MNIVENLSSVCFPQNEIDSVLPIHPGHVHQNSCPFLVFWACMLVTHRKTGRNWEEIFAQKLVGEEYQQGKYDNKPIKPNYGITNKTKN